MKKIVWIISILQILTFTSCQQAEPTEPKYTVYEDPDMIGFFSPTPAEENLLSEEEFLDRIKESPYVQEGDIMAFSDFIELVGRPQRELRLPMYGMISAELNPGVKFFQWDLKNGASIEFYVCLLHEPYGTKANPNNLMSCGTVVNVLNTSLPDGDDIIVTVLPLPETSG